MIILYWNQYVLNGLETCGGAYIDFKKIADHGQKQKWQVIVF